MTESPDGRVTGVFEVPSERTAAYRFLRSEHITPSAIMRGISGSCVSRIAAHGEQRVLVALDKSALSLTESAAPLHPLMPGKSGAGLWSLNALAMCPNTCQPLGILAQLLIERNPIPVMKRMTEHQAKTRPWKDKESYEWMRAIEQGMAALQRSSCEVVPTFIIDREGDVFNLFARAKDDCFELVVRAQVTGRLDCMLEQSLKELIDEEPDEVFWEIDLPRQKRRAHVGLSWTPVSIRGGSNSEYEQSVVHLWVVQVRERSPPAGATPTEWILVTTRYLDDVMDALSVVEDYTARWHIERLHHSMKQIMRVERTQLRHLDSLKKWIHMSTEAAFHVQEWMSVSRETPERLAHELVDAEIIAAVLLSSRAHVPALTSREVIENVTMGELVLWLALSGGYVNQKGQGPPGQITLGRGWLSIQGILNALYSGRVSMPE